MLPSEIFAGIVRWLALVPAVVLHEVAHGWVAWRLGDPTAKSRGRLSLNPLNHIDPIGTILLPAILLVLRTGFLIGYAKPVPINASYFRNPLKGMLYTAVAGPSTNLLLAATMTILVRIALLAIPDRAIVADGVSAEILRSILAFCYYFVIWNVVLTVFNLIPIPPLDGSRVLAYFLKANGRRILASLERYGFLIVFAIFLMESRVGGGPLSWILGNTVGGWHTFLGDKWTAALYLFMT
jgi:Zn-dependent protease